VQGVRHRAARLVAAHIAHPRAGDSGKPTVVADPDGRGGEHLPGDRAQARGEDRESARDMTSKFPNIVVSKNTDRGGKYQGRRAHPAKI